MQTLLIHLLALLLAIALAACAPYAPSPTTLVAVTPLVSTAISGSGSGTVLMGTLEPVIVTLPPPNFTPPSTEPPATLSPIPPLAGGIGPTELKYRLLAQFPDLFFCDPDYYPVARMDELELAKQRLPEFQANTEEFDAILAHHNLVGVSSFSDEQTLLIYQEHKKLAALHFTLAPGGYQFQLLSAKTEGNGQLITGLIDHRGEITVQQRQPAIATCPICLAAGTRIDTPSGPVPVENLRVGMVVWTLNRAGMRIAEEILQVSRTIVPSSHKVVQLMLDDGRQLWVSAGHPIGDGRMAGKLQAGDILAGARVVSAERVPYPGFATYDLLPAGETGFYWANRILVASTLKNP